MNRFFASMAFLGLATPNLGFANYQQAQVQFAKKNYAKSAPLFYEAYTNPQSNAERYKAEWGLAQSLRSIGLMYSASRYYSIIIRRGYSEENAFFRPAMEELGKVNSILSLGESHINQLLKAKISPERVPGPARGFYFHYLGLSLFRNKQYAEAEANFRNVPQNSEYYLKSLFHRGVIANLSGRSSQAVDIFIQIRNMAKKDSGNSTLLDQANLNIARILYEEKRYREAINYYATIPRFTEYWLQAIFESSWAFFLMQKHNNTLGNIHTIQSPFFTNRFYPESYILQAITYLRLCRFDEVKQSMRTFKNKYFDVARDLKAMLREYKENYNGFFKLVYDYSTGTIKSYHTLRPVFDEVSRVDVFKEALNTIRFSDKEIARLSQVDGDWIQSGLKDELTKFLEQKKSLAVSNSGRNLLIQARYQYEYLMDLSRQTELINAEMLLGKVDQLRAKLNFGTSDKKAQFIGGMQPLVVGEDLEYWPFEGEYWKDELGGYVYNLGSMCSKEHADKD